MDLNLFSISGLVLSLTCFVLLLMILKFGTRKLHYIWALFNISLIIWGSFAFAIGKTSNEDLVFLLWKIAHIGIILIPILFFHVIYLLCELNQKKTLLIIYFQGAFFLALNFFGSKDIFISAPKLIFQSFYYFTAGVMYHLFFAVWIAIVFYGILQLFIAYRKAAGGIRRNQILYFLVGLCVGFSGGLTNFFPIYDLKIYPVGNFAIPLYCVIATYAIMRYRLMDIHLVIKKGMVYSLSGGILASLFVVLILIMTKYLENVAGATSHAITIIAALTIAVLFNPLKNSVQKIIDKNFYKRTYNYYDVIRDISHKLTTMFELKTIHEYIANTIFDTFGLHSIYVLNAASGRNCEVVYQRLNKYTKKKELNIAEQGNLTHNSELIRLTIETENILIKDELPAFEGKIGQDGIERIRREFELFEGELAASVFIEDQLALLLLLGEKLSGDMFTREDINMLKTISDQIAIATKNARLYKEKLDSEKLASIGMMAATFAHEVRNPLTSLKTFAQLMPEKYNDIEFREGFSKIVVGEIQKIDDLICDLLDFSAEKKSARVTEYDLVGLVDESIDYVKSKLSLAHKNIMFEKEYACESFIMMGDMKQLRQLFTNLMTNGCQAMNGEGTLRVEIHPDGDSVDVTIADTGKGIHPDDIQKIFDPFVTNRESGTGLGLPISKKIVEEHNGSLRVESMLSEGAMFTVTLPVQNK